MAQKKGKGRLLWHNQPWYAERALAAVLALAAIDEEKRADVIRHDHGVLLITDQGKSHGHLKTKLRNTETHEEQKMHICRLQTYEERWQTREETSIQNPDSTVACGRSLGNLGPMPAAALLSGQLRSALGQE